MLFKVLYNGYMNICISKDITGTETDIEIPFEDSTSQNIPIIGSSGFEDLARLYAISVPKFPSEPYRKCYGALLRHSSEDTRVPWESCMPTTRFHKELSQFTNSVVSQIASRNFDYYHTWYQRTNGLFDYLSSPRVNIGTYNKHMSASHDDPTKQGVSILKTFRPDRGLAPKTIYSKSSTVTGRLKVTQGANILHLNKEYRDILESEWQDSDEGSLVYLDYKSLEPRVLLVTNALSSTLYTPYIGSLPRDIYQNIIQELNLDGLVKREDIKTTVISLLYGATRESVCYRLKDLVDSPGDLVDLVVDYFGLEKLKTKLSCEYEMNDRKFISNFYGRPIWCDSGINPSTLVNYYVQSTSVDVALLGFQKIIDRLVSTNTLDVFSPKFVLHDALILDVHKSVNHLIPKLCKLGEDIPGMDGFKFFLESSVL